MFSCKCLIHDDVMETNLKLSKIGLGALTNMRVAKLGYPEGGAGSRRSRMGGK